jgi:helix-turn-helix protein
VSYTLGQAAKAATVSKTTIQRAIKSGRLSASRQLDGSYVIDPAELHRVFPRDGNGDGEVASSVTVNATGELRVEVEMLRERLDEKDAVIADLREDRDHWRAQAEQATRLLTDQRPAVQPEGRRGWWRRLRGR